MKNRNRDINAFYTSYLNLKHVSRNFIFTCISVVYIVLTLWEKPWALNFYDRYTSEKLIEMPHIDFSGSVSPLKSKICSTKNPVLSYERFENVIFSASKEHGSWIFDFFNFGDRALCKRLSGLLRKDIDVQRHWRFKSPSIRF